MLDFLKKLNAPSITLLYFAIISGRCWRKECWEEGMKLFCEENYWADSKLTDLGRPVERHHVLFLHQNQGEPCLMELALSNVRQSITWSELQQTQGSNPRTGRHGHRKSRACMRTAALIHHSLSWSNPVPATHEQFLKTVLYSHTKDYRWTKMR